MLSGKNINLPAKAMSTNPSTIFITLINLGVINRLSLSASFALMISVEKTVSTIDAKKMNASFGDV
jgi:hypothetical protein